MEKNWLKNASSVSFRDSNTKEQGVTPGLVVLLVGEDKASQTYVKNKELAAAKIGINSRVARYPESITEAELLAEIEQFNNDDAFHGIWFNFLCQNISMKKKYC